MVVKVDFDYDADYMYCPDQLDIDTLMTEFSQWIGDPTSSHPFWIGEGHIAVCYRADAIVYWLNQCVLVNSNEKAKVLEEMVKEDRTFDYAIVL
ncbi:MAG: hypothetical protein E7231_13395 [Cellulosilyticum sp.]|nr:hypothetical protein [Cellulosilyticum sp.]